MSTLVDAYRAALPAAPAGEEALWRALAQIANSARPPQPTDTRATARPSIPAVRIKDGTLAIHDNGGREATLQPVEFTGEQQGSLVWQYKVDAPPQLHVEGEIAPAK